MKRLILAISLMSLLGGGKALAAEQLTGTLAVLGPSAANAQVALIVGEERTVLSGELAAKHLPMLTALTVQVNGERAGNSFVVSSYELISVGGHMKPQLGYVRCQNENECAIAPLNGTLISSLEPAGAGAPMPIVGKTVHSRLFKMDGGLIWFVPKKLPDGKTKLQRFGLIYQAKTVGQKLNQGDPIAR